MSNLDYGDLLEDTIFPSFIISCKPKVSIEKLIKESYSVKKKYKSTKKSNTENSYHSPLFGTNESWNECPFPELKKLEKITCNFAVNELNNRKYNLKFKECYWWTNINQFNSYNLPHIHGRADLIAVYYVKMPKNCGKLTLMRNDGSHYSNLYRNNLFLQTFEVPAKEGRLYIMPGHLWHYVDTNINQEDRISLSYNLYFKV